MSEEVIPPPAPAYPPERTVAPPAPLVTGSTGSATPPKIEIENLSVTYVDRRGRSVHAVEDFNLRLENKPGIGELAVLLGPSGCGKSTIFRALAGLLTPDGGQVRVDGVPVVGPSRERGMVFQSYTSFAWLTVRENVEYGLKLHGVPSQERRTKALAILEQVGLKDFADAYPKQLSGGMKQRVAIARTLVNDPKLILMDEPFGALDPQTRFGMQSLVLDLLHHRDKTVVFVTHDISEAVFLADVIFVLAPRPTKVLHRLEVPTFDDHTPAVKQSAKFKEVENHLLEMLHSLEVHGNLRVGL